MPIHISTPFPSPVPIATLSPLPLHPYFHPIATAPLSPSLPPHSHCHHVATPSFFSPHIRPWPPHLHCYPVPITILSPLLSPSHPVPIATPSIFPLHLHSPPFPIATSPLFPPWSHGHPGSMITPSPSPPYPYCHLVPIATLFLFPPYFLCHPIPNATPSPPRGHPFVAGANRRPVPVAGPRATRCCRSVSHHHVASGV